MKLPLVTDMPVYVEYPTDYKNKTTKTLFEFGKITGHKLNKKLIVFLYNGNKGLENLIKVLFIIVSKMTNT